MEMLALQFFFQKCNQGAPLRKMHIKGNLAKHMNFERLHKSRLIVVDSVILWRKKSSVQDLEMHLYICALYVDITDQEII